MRFLWIERGWRYPKVLSRCKNFCNTFLWRRSVSGLDWSVPFEVLTEASETYFAGDVYQCFRPLYNYLREENSNNNDDDNDDDGDGDDSDEDNNKNAGHLIKSNTIVCAAIAILFWLL